MSYDSKSSAPKTAQLTPEQKRAAIPRLHKRLDELRALRVENISGASDPGMRTLEQAIDKTLVEMFGPDTVDYKRHREAAHIGPFSCGIPWSDRNPGLIEFVRKHLSRGTVAKPSRRQPTIF